MSTEWLKVMLEEIARKKSAEAEAQAELERRGGPTKGSLSGEDSVPRATPPLGPPASR